MSARALAKTYLKYWNQDPGSGDWFMADNAPTPLVLAVRTLPKGVSRNMAREALAIVAGNKATERPLNMLLDWLRSTPSAVAYCDNLLKSKKVPGSVAELVEKAYAAELQTARNHITTCLDRLFLPNT